jgi:murein DD-endopeptidase MepM/ murein hydrolase activator NlpD
VKAPGGKNTARRAWRWLVLRPCRAALAVALPFVLPAAVATVGHAQSASPRVRATTPADSVKAYERRIQEQEDKLKALRQDIEDYRARNKELGVKENSAAAQLRSLERETALTADLLQSLEAKQDRVESQLVGIRAEHDRATEILAERKRRMARTLRAMYVRGAPTTAEVVLRTASMHYALSHFKYLELVARNNERLLGEIRDEEQHLATTDAKLTETLYAIKTNADETREEKERLAQSKRARSTALKRVRQQRAEFQRALQDLAESERKVQSFISVLEKRRTAAIAAGRAIEVFPDVGFGHLRGAMPWPARGRVVAGFGRQKHPVYGTETFNGGIDIAAPEGSDVRCVARGQAEMVKWMDGYGKTVIINHGGGYYTVYAHLSQSLVTESQTVEPGEVIGRVGDTGSLDGVKLHFEVWSGAGGALNPMAWLGR